MEEIEISTIAASKTNFSVIIRNAYKRYTASSVVLNGLNLNVPEGTIYGLLGPSGCGKTTLLNCIVGRTELDAGGIQLKVKKRSEIGYMPQSLNLHDQMTIYENFYFYGYLFGMSDEDIQARAIDLISFLDLPSGYRFVKSLSGGQQRRVSIAVAFIHDPKILILDEPTVGLDPVLSRSIWDRLMEMTKRGKSIIITTHYIQEARQAHTIGLMRGGVLLAEEPPLQLMEKCGCSDLEEAFLTLSHKQEHAPKPVELSYPKNSQPVKAHFEDDNKTFSRTKFNGVMYKNLTLLKREYIFLVFVLVLPLLQTYLFNVAIGRKPKNIPLGVINDEKADCDYTAYQGCFLDENQTVSLSCLYLEFLQNETYKFVQYNNHSVALNDVRKNKVWGLLYFNENYTQALSNRVSYGLKADEEDMDMSMMDSWIDLSNQYIGNFIRYDIARSMVSFLQQALSNCGENPKVGALPLSFQTPIFGTFDENFISYASTAILCLCCFFFPSILTGGLVLTEKLGGMIERMMVAGVTIIEMMVSIMLIQMVVHVVQTTLVMTVMYCVFDNPFEGGFVTLSSLMMLTGFSGMFFGFMLAVINKDMTITAYTGIGTNIVLCFTSGLVWPIEAEHYLLRSVCWIFPLTWTVEAARGICSKGFAFLHPIVLRGFGSTIVWNLIFVYVVYFFMKYKKDVWVVSK